MITSFEDNFKKALFFLIKEITVMFAKVFVFYVFKFEKYIHFSNTLTNSKHKIIIFKYFSRLVRIFDKHKCLTFTVVRLNLLF
jgi:hypothetical protein